MSNSRSKKPRKSRPALSFAPIYYANRRLHVPRNSAHVPAQEWRPFTGRPIQEHWRTLAEQKGYRIHSRLRDRLHLALECKECNELTVQKIFTLRVCQPRCAGCLNTARITAAKAAGLTYLHPDVSRNSYGIYRAPCAHILRRQFVTIERVAKGEIGIRCEFCLSQREEKEAQKHGWTRISHDPERGVNYRVYQHKCGHQQSVARVNMTWGQVDCAKCGSSWTSKKSFIYLIQIVCPNSFSFIKLGYSAHPIKRFKHQLNLPQSAKVEIIKVVEMPHGHAACAAENHLHAQLRHRFPEAVIPISQFETLINVKSEIYCPSLIPEIISALELIEARITA